VTFLLVMKVQYLKGIYKGNKVGVDPIDIFPYDRNDSKGMSMADIKLFQSWFLLFTKPESREIKITILFEKLEDYHLFNEYDDSTDRELFLRLSGKNLDGTISFSDFLHALNLSGFYHQRESNVQKRLHSTSQPRPSLKPAQSLPMTTSINKKDLSRSLTTPTSQSPQTKPVRNTNSSFQFIRQMSRGILNRNSSILDTHDEEDSVSGGDRRLQMVRKSSAISQRFHHMIRDTSFKLFKRGSSRRLDSTKKVVVTRSSNNYLPTRDINTTDVCAHDSLDKGDGVIVPDQGGVMKKECSRPWLFDNETEVGEREAEYRNSIAAYFSRRDRNEDSGVRKVSKISFLSAKSEVVSLQAL
jgi:hypothetical protein